jgi:hypothetical protein
MNLLPDLPADMEGDGTSERPCHDLGMGRRDAVWWKSAVVYQIYPRSFADSNGGLTALAPDAQGRLVTALDAVQARRQNRS